MPLVTFALAALDLAAYALSLRHGGSFFTGPSPRGARAYGAVPLQLTGGHRLPTLLGALLVHGGFAQLSIDLLALAIFAPNVEDAAGRLRFVALALLGGLVAIAVAVALDADSTVPLLAASAVTAAVLGAYVALYPRARVLSLVLVPFYATIVAVPAVLLVLAWLGAQLWLALAGLADPVGGSWGIAYGALIAALIAGAPLARALAGTERAAAKRRPTPPQPVY